MDEDDFRFKERPKPKKRIAAKPSWERKILQTVREYILREPEDFVLKRTVVQDLEIPESQVGPALAALRKEGILEFKKVDPKEYNRVYLASRDYVIRDVMTWHAGRWIWGEPLLFYHKGFGNYRNRWTRRDPRRFKSKRDMARAQRKTPDSPVLPSQWDGKAYFVVRGKEFKELCRQLGFPENPKANWTCPKCRNVREYDDRKCENYKVSPPCDYQRLSLREWPSPPVKCGVCKRCGAELPPGVKTHKLSLCNVNVVRGVMEV